MSKAKFKRAVPYAKDALNLPVKDVDAAIPFYENTMGFQVVSRNDTPHKSVVLARDDVQIGLAENGGDPEQEGCYFQVEHIESAFTEIKGKHPGMGDIKIQKQGESSQRVFFVIAPDGLCYMLGEPE